MAGYRSRNLPNLAQLIITAIEPSPGSFGATPVRRVLGLDVGSKRIGMAVSDPLGITAQGLETLQRQNKRLDFEKLQNWS